MNFRRPVMGAELGRPEVARPGNFVSNFLRLKNNPSQIVAAARIAPKISQGQPPHLAHTVPDFMQIGPLSAELSPNARSSFKRSIKLVNFSGFTF